MIPRVIAAFTRFLSPIASSTKRDTEHLYWENRSSKRFKKKKQEPETLKKPGAKASPTVPETAPNLRLVPHPDSEQSAPEPQEASPSSSPSQPSSGTGSTLSFIQLFALLKNLPGALSRPRVSGSEAYRNATRFQKKAGKFKKGSILDERVG